ncbi:MAG TPA: anti-sigma factor [Thermoleophilaceae bacterium]|jgi:anti-sigma-K factor RskA
MASDHERYEQDAGAYLLGALPPLEAEVFERHLIRCEDCQRELARLRPAAEALPRSVEPFDPPPSLKASLMEIVEAEARPAPRPERSAARGAAPSWLGRALAGLRPRPALALAAIALLLGLVAGLGLAGGDEEAGTREVAASVDRTRLPGGGARLEVAEAGGAPATLRVTGMPMAPRGEVYEVWIERDGEVRPAGALFAVGRDGRGSAAIPGGVDGVERVMVTRERAGGAARPTEMPVIVAEV